MTPVSDFATRLNVSRETIDRLARYEILLRKWNPAINLVSSRTLDEVWERHFLDSAQLFDVAAPTEGHWVDLGSGGGFPGLVLAILSAQKSPDLRFTLVESDQRKAAFLTAAARELDLQVKIIAERIEKVPGLAADFLSARALAALPQLLGFAESHLKPTGMAIFPKGETWMREVDDAKLHWAFDLETVASLTDPMATILKIKGVSRV